MVDLETLDASDEQFVLDLLHRHHQHTSSTVAQYILQTWDVHAASFVKVMPKEYKKALQTQKKKEVKGTFIS